MNFSDSHHALLSAGRDFTGKNSFFIFAAYQLTFGPNPDVNNKRPAR